MEVLESLNNYHVSAVSLCMHSTRSKAIHARLTWSISDLRQLGGKHGTAREPIDKQEDFISMWMLVCFNKHNPYESFRSGDFKTFYIYSTI